MPFGLITKAQLDAKVADLQREIAEARALPEDIALEWADWYAKFRSLYMRLKKQEKAAVEVEPETGDAPGDGNARPPSSTAHLARRFRGF